MVRTAEDDFMEDDDLSAKMAKLAQERKGSELVKPKNLHLSSAVKQEERSASVTPLGRNFISFYELILKNKICYLNLKLIYSGLILFEYFG